MTALTDLGLSSYFAAQLERFSESVPLAPARISADSGDVWELLGCRVALAELAGRLRYALPPGGRPTTGDWVLVDERGERGIIHHVLERRTTLVRKAAGSGETVQVVAANADVVFIVTAADRDLNPRRLERYVTAVWDSGARPVVILNKSDLVDDPAAFIARIAPAAPGIAVVCASAQTGRGIEDLRTYVGPGTTIGFVGSSGVGKSTLINCLVGHELQRARGLGAEHKGRHTTTRRELVPLPGGGVLIDTPGMRELGLPGDETGLDAAFPEIAELADQCRFRDCRHEAEPGCAVRAAAEAGRLPPERLASYDKLHREIAAAEARRDPVHGANTKRRWKAIHKEMRAFSKTSGKRRG